MTRKAESSSPHLLSAVTLLTLQSKWLLMVAGCLRRVGRLEDALLQYREV